MSVTLIVAKAGVRKSILRKAERLIGYSAMTNRNRPKKYSHGRHAMASRPYSERLRSYSECSRSISVFRSRISLRWKKLSRSVRRCACLRCSIASFSASTRKPWLPVGNGSRSKARRTSESAD